MPLCVNSQIMIFRATSYDGLLTFCWIGDRGLSWPRIVSPSGFHPSRCSSGDKVFAVALLNNDK